jgi:hypothetical protein
VSRKFGPKQANHPSVGELCLFCKVPFVEGDYTTLIATAPADEEEARKMRTGRPYNACAIEVHFDCAALEYRE